MFKKIFKTSEIEMTTFSQKNSKTINLQFNGGAPENIIFSETF